MSVQIPIRLTSADPVAAPQRTRLLLPLAFSGVAAGAFPVEGDARQLQVLRAIAAAAALRDPSAALRLVKQSKDDPAVLVQTATPAEIKNLVAVVLGAMNQRPTNSTPKAEERAAATALSADPILVNVAAVELERLDKAGTNQDQAALAWVASIQPELLESAVRVGLRVRLLELPAPTTEISDLKKRVDDLDKRVKALEP